jgi:hypothetical protein
MESDSQKPAVRSGGGEVFFLLDEREAGLEVPFLGVDFFLLEEDFGFLTGMGISIS